MSNLRSALASVEGTFSPFYLPLLIICKDFENIPQELVKSVILEHEREKRNYFASKSHWWRPFNGAWGVTDEKMLFTIPSHNGTNVTGGSDCQDRSVVSVVRARRLRKCL